MSQLPLKALVKDLEAVSRNPGVKKRLLKIIETLKAIDTLDELHHLKKIYQLIFLPCFLFIATKPENPGRLKIQIVSAGCRSVP